MHALLECSVLMQLVMRFIPKMDMIEWLKDTASEWHARLMTWQNIICQTTLHYAFKVGDIHKLKNCLENWQKFMSSASMETWDVRTWDFVSGNYVSDLRNCHKALFAMKDPMTITRVLPFFQLQHASLDIKENFLCAAVGKLTLDSFVKLYTDCVWPSSRRLLCKLIKHQVDSKRAKPIIKWLVAQLETQYDNNVARVLCDSRLFSNSQYFIAKYLMRAGRMQPMTRNALFHEHLFQLVSPRPEFHKLTLLLWQKDIFLANYFLPMLDTTSGHYVNRWLTDNNNCELTQFDDEEAPQQFRRKRKHTSFKHILNVNDAWLRLPPPTSFEIKAADDTYFVDSDLGDVSSDTEDEHYDESRTTNLDIGQSMIRHQHLQCPIEQAQSILHDTVCTHITSSLAYNFMSHMNIVHNWTPMQHCTAFAHTCQRGRLSLACLLWNMAPPSLHPSLADYLCFAFQSNNPAFLQFAWDRASEQMRRAAPTAALFALQHRNFNTWQFLHDKQLLPEELLFNDTHKLWRKLCYVPPCFLRLVWHDTQAWRERFQLMLSVVSQANKRGVMRFLNNQNIIIDQWWLRCSIGTFTRLNLHRMLAKIHEPRTLDLIHVQYCYSLLLSRNHRKINDMWWNMYPLTREQLLHVRGFKWSKVKPSLMRHLWREGIANAHDLREYVNGNNDETETELFTFDLDQKTMSILQTK